MKFYKSPTMIVITTLLITLVVATVYRIATAIYTNPGLVTSDPYNSGKNYGDNLLQQKLLISQGYKLELKKDPYINYNKNHTYFVKLSKHNKPINKVVTAYFYRPSGAKFDFSKELTFVNNQYKFIVNLPKKGLWRITIEAKINDKILSIYGKIYAN